MLILPFLFRNDHVLYGYDCEICCTRVSYVYNYL